MDIDFQGPSSLIELTGLLSSYIELNGELEKMSYDWIPVFPIMRFVDG